MSQKNFLDKRGLTYFYDKINSSYLIKYQNMSTNKTDLAVIATKYDSTSTYSIGDYCVYQEKLYKCSANIETAETWNEQHWIEVTISDELENIYNLFEDVLLKPQTSGTQGQVLTADGQGGQSWEDSIASGIAASDANEDGNIIINNTINVELDERPTEDSVNGVTSGGVYDELEDIRDNLSQKYEKPSGGIPASDLAQGVIPEVPVTDVQMQGVSIVQDGVANIPNGNISRYGVLRSATEQEVKTTSLSDLALTTYTKHNAVFYGLAKAAGDITQSSSSNAVGTYTDDAKIKIQKMLGIYEAPWELIREDTFTNETATNHTITVDGNGQAFELTDCIIQFETPVQDTASSSNGGIYFYSGTNYARVLCNSWTQAAQSLEAHGCVGIVKQHNNLLEIDRVSNATPSNTGYVGVRYGTGFKAPGETERVGYCILSTPFIVNKIIIDSVTGTGHYKLLGKRKWN